MKSTRKGLRDGDLFKDTYERLNCADCEQVLKTTTDSDNVFDLRTCPECDTQYKDLR
ncbi:HVO_0758 family zinc finger protein [Halorubrum persicum]|uniref:HVO_0758 family zinc finger protein n=1 Tax=Halorubrum persicum TaxID=1383844 RepID=UPI0026E51BF8|nr:HVO_0758 family zinc finger protein [Halorubrum persicum]